ncbi:Serine protease persephone, partial [Pseudolycoriella hygida]
IYLLIICWSVEAVEWFDGHDGKVRWSNNCDFDGNDITSVKSQPEQCARLCLEHSECTRFRWSNHQGEYCWLKNGEGDAFHSERGGTCGYITVDKNISPGISWKRANQGKIKWSVNCYMSGQTIAVEQSGGDQCGSLCLSNPGCAGFNWKSGSCFLKSSAYPFVDNTNSRFVCGEIVGRRSPMASTGNSDGKRKSELACEMFTDMASDYRIIRGMLTRTNDFPWMAALYYPEDDGYNISFRCGGTIISKYYILTAAHCINGIEPTIARLGTHILNNRRKRDYTVESCTYHPNFNDANFKNDIGLVRVGRKILFSPKIFPACLRSDLNDLPRNENLVVTGWGDDGINPESNHLRKLTLVTVQHEKCNAEYRKLGSYLKYQIDDGQYCAEHPNEDIDACHGDSGGPLQVYKYPLATVVGVVSWARHCNRTVPGIYARVAYYLDWIEDIVWSD